MMTYDEITPCVRRFEAPKQPVTCGMCNGEGATLKPAAIGGEPGMIRRPCDLCSGKGVVWE